MSYAAKTEVPVEKSRAEIEATVKKYGAQEFMSGWNSGSAMIQFRLRDLNIRFILPIPKKDEKAFTHRMVRGYSRLATAEQALVMHDQEVRRRWRALCLVIKAKLEAVESKITTVEEEFMAHIVMPNDVTIGQFIVGNVIPDLKANRLPAIAGPKPSEPAIAGPKDDIVDI
jgi:hypothetical protein